MSDVTNRAAGPLTNRILNGRYQLEGRVGGGGMAVVYRARDMALNRTVAIKVLREQYGSDPKFLSRFQREAQNAANISHTNIVNVFDVGEAEDVHYIVMEFIAGETLRQYIDRNGGKLEPDTAAEIAAQVCAALAVAHRAGIIHRDVKPQNVLISTEGEIKVTDFGIAKGLSDMSMTEAGATLGTVQYFSPEQARGERVSAQSDIYSVGVILYEMLTGRLPFEADSMMGIALKHIEELPTPIRSFDPTVPRGLDAITLKALAKNPVERFDNAEAMEQALRNYAEFAPPPRRNTGGQRQPLATGTAGQRPVLYEQTGVKQPPLKQPPVQSSTYYEVEQRRGPGVGSWLLGLLVLALLIGGAIFAFTALPAITNPTPTPVVVVEPTNTLPPPPTATPSVLRPVPLVVTRSYTDAIRVLEADGYRVQVEQRTDRNVPFGRVISQSPESDKANLSPGTTVTIIVSLGPRQIRLGNYRNTEAKAAEERLKAAGLQVTIAPQNGTPAGVVAGQVPDPDTVVNEGDTVTLAVFNGQPAP